MKILLINSHPEPGTRDTNIDIDYVIPAGFMLPN